MTELVTENDLTFLSILTSWAVDLCISSWEIYGGARFAAESTSLKEKSWLGSQVSGMPLKVILLTLKATRLMQISLATHTCPALWMYAVLTACCPCVARDPTTTS